MTKDFSSYMSLMSRADQLAVEVTEEKKKVCQALADKTAAPTIRDLTTKMQEDNQPKEQESMSLADQADQIRKDRPDMFEK